ncbi:YbhB/YbcL family Raf kinase inhibitor-like protein [Azohydromonas lata]|uniref:YbhB/YbcL family Raf kinase inhibitor-like protein n=1 Tax=Azohydromonas lata TaxID=45677 RepID=A0ABU5IL84_9BURK|nr:YbhB/YbcL family Raf kinase inhibitor-like protein [Azohydromonas lata]MDZ5459656.1 YbhB/YbcL family Raf kinase inhibitor-like protein [Azohydromonas lata]
MLEKLPDLVGAALRGQRAGLDQTAFVRVPLRAGQGAIEVTSLAFADHAPLPPRFTADGEGHSPPLQWSGVPPGTASLLLIVEDADSPTPHPLVHAIAYDIPADEAYLAEGALNGDAADAGEATGAAPRLGRNSYLRSAWIPPDPPPAHGVHRYAFQLFALGPGVQWSGTPGRDAVLEALAQHALASGCLIGTYERHDTSVRDDDAAAVAVPAPVRPDLGTP